MGIPKQCKRLAEVDFPIAAVGLHSAREKSIRHGNPSTLHLWWARRPLASTRAVLIALLLPDPTDPSCPADFKRKARAALPRTLMEVGPTDLELRVALLRFIADFADWDKSADPGLINVARTLVRAAHGDDAPLVVDPFAGGGSIPLEALRVGCEAFASDLNPVACQVLTALVEDIPHHGPPLAQELARAGSEVRQAAEKEVGEFYPSDPDGARTIAYLWARTVRCESPNCGAEIPLVRSFWLSKRSGHRNALRYKLSARRGGRPTVEFEIFQPKEEAEVPSGSVSRAKATCLVCGATLAPDRVRSQLAADRGGADVKFDAKGHRTGGALLLAVVTLKEGTSGRRYRTATPKDYAAVKSAQARLAELLRRPSSGGLPVVPDEPTPTGGGSGAGRAFSVQKYGMMTFGDLFTARQKLALATIANIVASKASGRDSEVALKRLLAFSVSRLADKNASLAVWNQVGEKIEHVFGRQALPIVWDFAEVSIFSDATGNFESGVALVEEVVQLWGSCGARSGQVQLADARAHPLPGDSADVWFTDPPYYDAVPYSDLADFFFVWLKRTLPGFPGLKDPFEPSNNLTPKKQEAVQDEMRLVDGHPKDRQFFEDAMAQAFAEGRRVLRPSGVGCVVFAHKTTEGWEALLTGMVKNGWVITASWPIATERPGRLRSHESAALATSVHLVSRPRQADAPVGEWAEVLRELPERVRVWMDRLSAEGVRGADLVFACIGPAMEVYSRYSKVVDAEDREVPLGGDPEATEPQKRGYLAHVWEVVGRLALERVLGKAGATGSGLEEDARLTALFLWTLQSSSANGNGAEATGDDEVEADAEDDEDESESSRKKKAGWTLPFDVARRFAQPLGIHLDAWEGRILETEKGIVRLLPVAERKEQLFGSEGMEDAAEELGAGRRKGIQLTLTEEGAESPRARGKGRKKAGASGEEAVEAARRAATTLDRVHAAMLLQSAGQTAALRTLLMEEKRRGPDFERLSNALAALYPRGSEERRLVEAMLLAMPR